MNVFIVITCKLGLCRWRGHGGVWRAISTSPFPPLLAKGGFGNSSKIEEKMGGKDRARTTGSGMPWPILYR